MNKHICSLSQSYKIIRARSISGNDDRAVSAIESKCESGFHWRMFDQRCGDLDVFVLHDQPGTTDFVWMHERNEGSAALVGDACVDIEAVHLEEQACHFGEWGRTPCVDASLETGSPRQPDEVAIIRIVIGVMM